MTTREKEEQLDAYAQDLYEGATRTVTPMYPWVFVRVLPRAQTTRSGLILPEKDQNKAVHEGIVLATWKTKKTFSFEQCDICQSVTVATDFHESDLKPGDHVLFPHWAGLPVSGFDERNYRLVKEEAWDKSKEGGIFATIEYDEAATHPVAEMTEMIDEFLTTFEGPSTLAEQIYERFILVDRQRQSVTLSGSGV